jgi:hypothetical protein
MILLGTALVFFFLVAGYLSLGAGDKPESPKMRGPVKDPRQSGPVGALPVVPPFAGMTMRFG